MTKEGEKPRQRKKEFVEVEIESCCISGLSEKDVALLKRVLNKSKKRLRGKEGVKWVEEILSSIEKNPEAINIPGFKAKVNERNK